MNSQRVVYPVILVETDHKKMLYHVHVPDFDCDTSGKDLADALYMAEDLIALMSVTYEDEGKELPAPTPLSEVQFDEDFRERSEKTLVAADIKAYRAKIDNRAVKKTLSIPSWLNQRAEKAHINFSATLQEALKQKLGIKN